MRKAKLIQTCGGCPSQWEGYTDKNEPVYIRFRWGYLSVQIGKVGQDIMGAVGSNAIFGQRIGDEYDGTLSFEELKQRLAERLDVEEVSDALEKRWNS